MTVNFSYCNYDVANTFKGATKSYFAHYSCVVIILFNTGLCRPALSPISFRKPVFRLSVLSVFFVFNQDIKIHVIILKRSSCYVILFSPYKNSRSSHQRCSIKKQFSKFSQYSQESNCVGVFF